MHALTAERVEGCHEVEVAEVRVTAGREFAQFAVAETVLRADDGGVDDFGYVSPILHWVFRGDAN